MHPQCGKNLHIRRKKMAKKTWLRGAALVLIAALALAGCSKKAEAQVGGSGGSSSGGGSASNAVKEAPESDFTVELTKDSTGVRINKYTGNAKAVRIPATMQGLPVREIVDAFKGNKTVTSIVIPEGVTTIYGFEGCENLTSVNFPTTLTVIGVYTFTKTKLTAVDLSMTSVKYIGNHAFGDCTALTTVALPASIGSGSGYQEGIGAEAFGGCSNLTSITISETVTKIQFDGRGNSGSFNGCSSLPLATQGKLRELGYTGGF
jgi:hypothetical protein